MQNQVLIRKTHLQVYHRPMQII